MMINRPVKSRKVNLAAVAALMLFALILYPQAIRTFKALHQPWGRMTDPGFLDSLARQVRTPLAGEQVLPPAVQSMLGLLRANNVVHYRYSETIARNEELRQRLIEGALPIRYAPDARSLVLMTGETFPPHCRPVANKEGVTLALCP